MKKRSNPRARVHPFTPCQGVSGEQFAGAHGKISGGVWLGLSGEVSEFARHRHTGHPGLEQAVRKRFGASK